MVVSKRRIQRFYDVLSPHFRRLWGPHLHDGYYATGDESRQAAQDKLVEVLAELAGVRRGSAVLDVGCGMGATSVALARRFGCEVTGITLSPVQVEIARELARAAGVGERTEFAVMDACAIDLLRTFDLVWMVGVLGHLPDQRAFVTASGRLLRPGGRFLLADWMVPQGLDEPRRRDLVDPVLDGMLMPQIFALADHHRWLESSGYRVLAKRDLTPQTRRTWDEGVAIARLPAVVRLSAALGRDAVGLLRAIRGMRRAMAAAAIVYGVLLAERT